MNADAVLKFLMIEIPTHSDSDTALVNIIRDFASDFPMRARKSTKLSLQRRSVHFERASISFWLWNARSQTCSDQQENTVGAEQLRRHEDKLQKHESRIAKLETAPA